MRRTKTPAQEAAFQLDMARNMVREAKIRRDRGETRVPDGLEQWACNAWCRAAEIRLAGSDLFATHPHGT